MISKHLFRLLKTFTPSQFTELRYELDLPSDNFTPNAPPVVTADEFIKFVSQRDNKDLSSLEKAVEIVVTGRAMLEFESEPEAPAEPGAGVPQLHLLCDRVRPVQAVRRFCEASADSGESVLALIILGDKEQAHELLLERLRVFELRSASGQQTQAEARLDERKVFDRPFNLPDEFIDSGQFQRELENEIRGGQFRRVHYPTLTRLADAIYRRGDIVLLHTKMYYSDWRVSGRDKVEAFLGFFANVWPRPPSGHRLLVCLKIRFDHATPFDWWDRVVLVPTILRELGDIRRKRPDLLPPDRLFDMPGVALDEARAWLNLDHVTAALATISCKLDEKMEAELDKVHHESRGSLLLGLLGVRDRRLIGVGRSGGESGGGFFGLAAMERLADNLKEFVAGRFKRNGRTGLPT